MDKCQTLLLQGLQALGLSYHQKQVDSLLTFIKLIDKWNKTYNLTAVRNPEEMVQLHILDSLAVLPYLEGGQIADIGTGAGLPGIPLAVFLPDAAFTLLDSNAKKTRFVQQAVLELKLLNITVEHCRIEQFQPQSGFSTVIMRAFSSLEKIIESSRHIVADSGIILAMKGRYPEQELKQIVQSFSLIPITVPGIEAERCLIRIGPENGR